MAGTEALDRSAYGANLSNYEYWQNFLANQSQQARTENDNFWNNLWQGIQNVGNVAKTAYDGYMGYTQQKWENDFAREQWEYNKNRTDQSDALGAYQDAFNLYKQGAGDASADILNRYGLNADAFANYTGAPVTRDDQASVLTTAASLVASGNSEAAANLLKMYGMDADAAGDYNTMTQRALSTALAKSAATGSGRSSSGGSGSSGGSSSKNSYTPSNVVSLMTQLGKYKVGSDMYNTIAAELAKAGVEVPGYTENQSGSTDSGKSGSGIGLAALKELNQSGKWAPATASTGSPESQSTGKGMPYSNALSYAKGWSANGLSEDDIYNRLVNLGITDDVAAKVWNAMGW